MAEPRTPRRLVAQPIDLDRLVGNDAVWKAIVEIAAALRSDEWALVGGQMVALHGFVSGVTPPRATDDIDIVADVIVRRGVLSRCAGVLESLDYVPQPSITGRTLHRFTGARGHVDLVVPDHVPASLVSKLRGYQPVPIVGGRRALDRAALVPVGLGERRAEIAVPDLLGAVVLKARAAVTDNRDAQRHLSDIAFLCSLVADPLEMRDELDAKERRSLRRVDLLADPSVAPWVFLPAAVRADSAEAWGVLRGP
jgi:predicted nucleotidyltransferase